MTAASDIADRLDLDRSRRGWRGNCPCCGYKDSFVLRAIEGRTVGWCASCGDTGAISGVIAAYDRGEAVTVAAAPPAALPAPDRIRKAMATWNGAQPCPGTPAARYLAGRGLPELAASAALRWRSDVAHPEERGLFPAMLALVQDAAGRPLGVHRHYLTRDGRKAALRPAKASSGVIGGGFVCLDPVAPEMVVGEGVESSASAGVLFSLPVLAAVSAGNLGWALVLPPEVRSIVIAADHDPVAGNGRRPGHAASDAACRRWQAEGRSVRIAMPSREGEDFNDILMQRLGVVLHG